jgi:hypothetical protein
MWKNFVQPGRLQMTIRGMRTACWISKSTNTHSEHVILTAFSLQQWLHERASLLHSNYTVCLVVSREGPYYVHLCNQHSWLFFNNVNTRTPFTLYQIHLNTEHWPAWLILFVCFRGSAAQSRAMASSFTRFLDHTRRATIDRTPLDEWSARRRDLYLTTHNTHDRHPCNRCDSNPRSQQASGRRPTP